MLKDLKVCTISKYPPYMSGHSFEALYQGKALFEMTGDKHYEVTYDPSVYDKATNYNNSPELMSEAEQYLHVYRMLPDGKGNVKVLARLYPNHAVKARVSTRRSKSARGISMTSC